MEYQDPNHRHRHQQNNRSQEPNHRHNNVNRARAAQQNRRPTPEKDDITEFATISNEGFANMKPMGFAEMMQAKSEHFDKKAQEMSSMYKLGDISAAQLNYNTKSDSEGKGSAMTDPETMAKEINYAKQDNTRVDGYSQKANFIQAQEEKRNDFSSYDSPNVEEAKKRMSDPMQDLASGSIKPVYPVYYLLTLPRSASGLAYKGASKSLGAKKGSNKNSKHANKAKREAAEKRYQEAKKEFEQLKSKPNKTPEDKKMLAKAKKAMDSAKKQADFTGENHSQNSKGN